ncbi:MAG: GNAT family N-acetyltransferase [Deltaproteobacteria bacterium]|nr:GNAT family N-acetyltransferase [Deltaproteobacteria bacterium]
MSHALSFRPITGQDAFFLRKVYGSTRWEELNKVAWSDEEKEAFLDMQFQAQHTYYQEHYADADYLIIFAGRQPAGRLYLHRREDEIRVVDIALLPEFRNQGIGTIIFRDIFHEAGEKGLPVRIHVEQMNRTQSLYQRLGFAKIGEHGIYDFLEWRPDAAR